MRLAEYLYYSGSIAWQDVIGAVVWQRQHRPKFGELAIEQGYLTERQLLQAMRLRIARRSSLPIAAFMTENGVLTDSQCRAILNRQQKMQPPIGGYFVDHNILDREVVEAAVSLRNRACVE